MPVALHLAPHPDDELLGCGGTLLRLLDAGWTVVNLGCSLGRPGQHERREAELRDACRRAGLELRLPAAPIAMSTGDDLAAAQEALVSEIAAAIAELHPALVLGPSPHDGHPGHEVVGRATYAALQVGAVRPRWWIWTLWGHAPTPSLFVPLDDRVMQRTADALAAHRGELARTEYGRLLRARSEVAAVAGAEQVFGWGAAGERTAYAEVLTELLTERGGWLLARPRRPGFGDALAGAQSRGVDLCDWLQAPGTRTAILDPRARAPGSTGDTTEHHA